MLTGEMVVDFYRANTEAEEAELLQMLESGGHEKHLKTFKRLIIHREILEDVLRKACKLLLVLDKEIPDPTRKS